MRGKSTAAKVNLPFFPLIVPIDVLFRAVQHEMLTDAI